MASWASTTRDTRFLRAARITDPARIVVGSARHESRPQHSQQSFRAASAAFCLFGPKGANVCALRFRNFSGHQGSPWVGRIDATASRV
jgi:hypothetical protein